VDSRLSPKQQARSPRKRKRTGGSPADDDTFEVERVLAVRTEQALGNAAKSRQYLIKAITDLFCDVLALQLMAQLSQWKGYNEHTWEPEVNLHSCEGVLAAFECERKRQQQSQQTESVSAEHLSDSKAPPVWSSIVDMLEAEISLATPPPRKKRKTTASRCVF
jgi:hypothetical protein